MAIPSEYQDHPTTTGATNMKHPLTTISLSSGTLSFTQESIGPLTNLKTGTVLHPDMYDSNPDRGREHAAQHAKQVSTWLPGLLAGDNQVWKGDETAGRTLEMQGAAGTYLETLIDAVEQ